ncbi:hypothetical protein GTP58_00065 [Duganella sp. CY15W]|uniref:hypothetical protein n=1 Tax=Duganella sp. CY15W TaxID=2692172 RepID=UPI00136CA51C|nr:hypothetical protein [Duganella sp. CY15W]MYM26710.1 hypothetical protein [Duganella sp. CY15W]
MSSASKAAAGLLFTFSAAMAQVHAAPDIVIQSIPFDLVAQEPYANISADGRYVSFKLQQRRDPAFYPVNEYIQDMRTGQRVQANLTLTGDPAPTNAACNYPSMNATGRYLVFTCVASYMGGKTAGGSANFVYDKETNTTQMIPDTGDDRPGNNGTGISADGRFVAFRTTTAQNVAKIYVRDMVNKITSSTNAQGVQLSTSRVSISGDGRYIGYAGRNIGGTFFNISVYDRVTGTTEPIDVRMDGSRSTINTSDVSMSDDGMIFVFVSTDKALSPTPPMNNNAGAYVRDRKTGKTEMVSYINGTVQYAAVSGNGRYVGYVQAGIMYVYDRFTKLTRKIVQTSMQVFGPPSFSADGRYVVFTVTDVRGMQSITIADLGIAPGVTLSTNQLTLTEGGNAGTYSVSLNQAPNADVKIKATTNAQLSLVRSELTFTPANWSSPQIFSVQAVADGITEGKHSATIAHTVASADPGYAVVQPADVTVAISDGIIPTIVIPSTNWGRADMPLNGTAAPGSTVLLTAANRSTGWLSSVSTVADAQGKWSYTLTGYTDGVIDLDAQADGIKSVVHTINVNLAPTYIDVSGYIRTTGYGLAYNRATGKYVGNIVLANTGSISLAGPLHLQFNNLTAGIILSNATGSHNGSPYITVQGALEPDGTVTIPLVFDNPGKTPINYDNKIYSGIF